MNRLNQIYHVARCGSTLLTALVSNCERTFSEPSWTHGLFGTKICPDEITDYYGSIVKLQSIATRIGFKPTGPKVFLYRPLAQYLYKMSTCSTDWIDNRKQLYGTWWDQIKGQELNHLEPETILQLHAIFWSACVLEMQKTDNVLWIESNTFFSNKEETAKQVLAHFDKKGTPEMEFSSVNVKSLNLNGGKIDPLSKYITESIQNVSTTHGIVDTTIALENNQINNTLQWAYSNLPVDLKLYFL